MDLPQFLDRIQEEKAQKQRSCLLPLIENPSVPHQVKKYYKNVIFNGNATAIENYVRQYSPDSVIYFFGDSITEECLKIVELQD